MHRQAGPNRETFTSSCDDDDDSGGEKDGAGVANVAAEDDAEMMVTVTKAPGERQHEGEGGRKQ